jgi:ABC-2 type transport system ATP-binding protein
MNIIEVEGLSRRFGQFTAVDNVSFQVEQGAVFGLLGPNGAGKTTTIRCLLTLIRPSSGSARIAGIDVVKKPEQVRQITGYVPQDVSIDGDLSGYENLLLYAKLFHVPRAERRRRIDEVLEFLQLTDRANDIVRAYSGGMMRRLEIGQVLVNRPKVLFLDEPSIGLDPAAKRMVWDYVVRMRDEFGATILLTTHDMYEADELCDRVAIMNGGKIVVSGSPEELKETLGGDVVSITTSVAGCGEVLQGLGYHLLGSSENGMCDVVVSEADSTIPRILEGLRNRGINVTSISLKRATLDDVFLKYAGKRIEDGEPAWRGMRAARRAFRRRSK